MRITAEKAELEACFEALAAMALADQELHEKEATLLRQLIVREGVPPELRGVLERLEASPPNLEDCLLRLRESSDLLRQWLMVQLVEMVWADDVLAAQEDEQLGQARSLLKILPRQLYAIQAYVVERRSGSADGADGDLAREDRLGRLDSKFRRAGMAHGLAEALVQGGVGLREAPSSSPDGEAVARIMGLLRLSRR